MEQFHLDLQPIIDAVKEQLHKPPKIWDDIVPILETDECLTIYLTEPIGMPGDYNEACHKVATSTKPVTIVENTPGGSAHTAFQFVDAMKRCSQPIHCHITGSVASAGTIIAMHCDTLEMSDHSEFMIHNYSHGTQGSGAQVKDYVDFTDREFSKAVTDIYAGFLTPDEMEQVSRQDKELWFNKAEVLERWNNKQNS